MSMYVSVKRLVSIIYILSLLTYKKKPSSNERTRAYIHFYVYFLEDTYLFGISQVFLL